MTTTINPLFLDSTKLIGDKVVTNVELINILLHDSDSLYFELIDQFGFEQRIVLQSIQTKKSIKYKAEVLLNYQHQIKYRFFIESEGKPLFTSAIREARVGQVIAEKWEPCFSSEFISYKKDKTSTPNNTDIMSNLSLARKKKSTSFKPLLQPQIFEQINFLLNDLL